MERQPLLAGAGIALVGYTSSFAVVLAGLRAVGADQAQATSGLVAVSATTAVGTLWLSRHYHRPLTLAWSTPGAAVLASATVPSGGWAAAVGAFVVTGLLVVLTGALPVLAALIQRIPGPIAQAMLAGVVLELCLAPVSALRVHPWQVAPILLTWLVLARFAPRWAVPAAFLVLLVVVGVDAGRDGGASGTVGAAPDVDDAPPLIRGRGQHLPAAVRRDHGRPERPRGRDPEVLRVRGALAGRDDDDRHRHDRRSAVRRSRHQPGRDQRRRARLGGGAPRPRAPLAGGVGVSGARSWCSPCSRPRWSATSRPPRPPWWRRWRASGC